jgi:CubicO group peptidase (beta-lactamase class C family)
LKNKKGTHFLTAAIIGLLFLSPVNANSSEKIANLKVGQLETATIGKGDIHSYSLNLKENQFVLGEAMQIEVDAIVTIYDPAGHLVNSFDGPSTGSEGFQFNSKVSGEYKITVSPFEETKGKYSLKIFVAEPIATTPEGKVDQAMAIYNDSSPGGVVAVVRDGKIDFVKGYGMANVEYNIPNTASTPYHMASVSKQFTAYAIAMLAKDGKLSIDDDVRKHLPNLADFGKTITLRHLLNHTSGLRDHWNLWAMSGGRMDDVIRQQDLIRLIERQRELNFAPGEEHLYSNTGYLLLSEVVSTVSGEEFGVWMHKHVFKPLGMNSTQIYNNHERIVKGRAYSYHNSNEGLAKSVLSYANSGATSLFTTAEDLALWLQNFHTGEVGGMSVIKEVQVQGILNNGKEIDYALGVAIGKQGGLRKISHGGADAGFRTSLSYYPKINSGVIILGNISSFPARSLSNTVAESFFESEMTVKAKHEVKKDNTENKSVSRIPEEIGKPLIGKFIVENGPTATITYEDGKLTVRTDSGNEFDLLNLGDNLFKLDIPDADIRIQFAQEQNGEVNRATLHQNGETPMRRMEEWTPDKKELSQFVGRYYSDELETFYSIAFEEDELYVKHRRHGNFALTPKERNSFGSNRWYLGDLKFADDVDGKFKSLSMSNGRVRHLKFKRTE